MRAKYISVLREPLQNERGMALLVTVMVVSLLIAVTVHLVLTVRQEIVASTHAKQRSYLQATARSGLQWGVAALEKDSQDNSHDSLSDDWENIKHADFSPLLRRGKLNLKITDMAGKLQINSLDPKVNIDAAKRSKEILTRLLKLKVDDFGIGDPAKVPGIVDALVDWVDDDDITGADGAEDSHYLSLTPPYKCRSGPVEFIDELLLVKGINDRILFGDKVHEKSGLADFITVLGSDGKININTAYKSLLQAMTSDMTEERAQEMVNFRKPEEGNQKLLADKDWYTNNIPSMAGGNFLDPATVKIQSLFFQIDTTAEINKLTRKITVIVERDPSGKVKFLTRTVE